MKRRKYLKEIGSAGAAASLAGCPGGGKGEEDETSQTEEPTGTGTKDTTEDNSDGPDGDTTEDSSGGPDESGGDGGLWLQAQYEHPEKNSAHTLDYWFPENTDLETVLESTPESTEVYDTISLAHGNYRPDANVGEEIEIDGSTCYMAAHEYAEEMARDVLSGNGNSLLNSDEVYSKRLRAVLETFWGESSEINIHEEDGESVRKFPSREEEPDILYSVNKGDEDSFSTDAILAWEEDSNFYAETVTMTQMEIDSGNITSADYHSTYEDNRPMRAWVADADYQGL